MLQVTGIRKITPQNGSKTVAFIDADFSGLKVRSFRLVDFDGNMQIQPPSREATAKEKAKGFKKDYAYTCSFTSEETKAELLKLAVEAYNAAN